MMKMRTMKKVRRSMGTMPKIRSMRRIFFIIIFLLIIRIRINFFIKTFFFIFSWKILPSMRRMRASPKLMMSMRNMMWIIILKSTYPVWAEKSLLPKFRIWSIILIYIIIWNRIFIKLIFLMVIYILIVKIILIIFLFLKFWSLKSQGSACRRSTCCQAILTT